MYDNYRGAIPYIRVFDGILRPRDKIKIFVIMIENMMLLKLVILF